MDSQPTLLDEKAAGDLVVPKESHPMGGQASCNGGKRKGKSSQTWLEPTGTGHRQLRGCGRYRDEAGLEEEEADAVSQQGACEERNQFPD